MQETTGVPSAELASAKLAGARSGLARRLYQKGARLAAPTPPPSPVRARRERVGNFPKLLLRFPKLTPVGAPHPPPHTLQAELAEANHRLLRRASAGELLQVEAWPVSPVIIGRQLEMASNDEGCC